VGCCEAVGEVSGSYVCDEVGVVVDVGFGGTICSLKRTVKMH